MAKYFDQMKRGLNSICSILLPVLQKIRERLTLVLLGLLPLHAFLVTVFTRVIAGSNQAPLIYLALWKEGFLAIILFIALIEIFWPLRKGSAHLSLAARLDWVDALILLLLNVGIVVSAANPDETLTGFFYGFKYDFIPIISFFVLRRVAWSDTFLKYAVLVVLGIAGMVAIYGLDTFFLPDRFFRWIGYSDLHSLYVPGGPIAAFQFIGGTMLRRIQATFSGPNQFGLWLLLPWSLLLVDLLQRFTFDKAGWDRLGKLFSVKKVRKDHYHVMLFILVDAALGMTFSRAAWLAAGIIFVIAVIRAIPLAVKQWGRRVAIVTIAVAIALCLIFPAIFLRPQSSRAHIDRPMDAFWKMIEHPFGWGLASAGPASNRLRDACVYLPAGSDVNWARAHRQLCVFVDDIQVQPVNRACRCPYLPENWYLQIGVEMGLAGLALFVAITIMLLQLLYRRSTFSLLHSAVFYAFLGISIASLFLHAWEDSAVAYTMWLLAAVAVTAREKLST